jgi:hypothetical protein
MFTKQIQAVIQGMLDARKEMELPEGQVVLSPYSHTTERELFDYWYEGYDAHRPPKIVS